MAQNRESDPVEEQPAKADFEQQDDSQRSESAFQEDASSDLAKQFEETRKELLARIDKTKKEAQSTKDKEFANLRKELAQVQESIVALAEISKGGAVPSTLRGNAEQDDTSRHVRDIFAQGLGVEASAVENTPEYIDFVKSGGLNLRGADGVASAAKFVVARAKPQTQLSAGAVAQGVGGGAVQADEASLTSEYQKELDAIPNGEVRRVMDLKKKYREKGLKNLW